jgi:hypothetical protein
MVPFESMLAREKGRVLLLAAGQAPVLLDRAVYFREAQFKGIYDDKLVGQHHRGSAISARCRFASHAKLWSTQMGGSLFRG